MWTGGAEIGKTVLLFLGLIHLGMQVHVNRSNDFYALMKKAELAIEELCDYTENLDGLMAAHSIVLQQSKDMLGNS